MPQTTDKQALLRKLPAVDRLLKAPAVRRLETEIPHPLLLEACQRVVDRLRQEILRDQALPADLAAGPDAVAERAAILARQLHQPSLRPVINATGTLLHTNLGRSPLCRAALEAVTAVSRGYSNLEFDLASGERGHRYSHVEDLLCRLTGAEAATVVNNNAGAVLLALTTLARGKEAIVSRGEMVEIGGAFRIPDVMAAGGVILREVGTTNKTHLRDYRQAIGERTGLLLKVHTSNYRIVGFHAEVAAAELVELGREHGLPVIEDLGSGMLIDLSNFGLPREPTVRESVAAGLDLVTFSGDKLLGGPQAGLIVGRREAVEKVRRHPMARALRIDKMTLAALEATLRLYLDRERLLRENPVLRLLQMTPRTLADRCRRLAKRMQALGERAEISVVRTTARVGGGALPLTELPGYALAVRPRSASVTALNRRLRQGRPPVVGRVQEDRLLFDLRTVLPGEDRRLLQALTDAFDNL
ncbi:L-seryl-tRNA(Sec) selenium transferase [Geothermobacter ehrlichii]|uniref:L-seryl-tRNA(Sec) selenium transferase n=1 Tax=Geothermobacter ehrlichii TaxID=213224 RepID=A0A5D3WHF6_9BACT|nr:L-seryl-tRNA(Sec) selenium transferase [Geothermobacter ehrlichii]TYO96113.1 L-seryl-tRNA(Sec) selenium transferase [Geothermobacter ehrlichii]